MQGNPCLREKVHIWLGSLPVAISFIVFVMTFICSFIKNVACVRVGKSEDHFFFGHSPKLVDKKFFGKNGHILGKFTKGA